MVCQPRSSGNGEHHHQSQEHHKPYVECAPANSAKTLFVTSESPSAQPVAHVLHPQAKACDSDRLASLTTHLWASFAVFAKRVIHAMSEDHAAAARERDSNFAPVGREQISEVGSGADQRQSERCSPEHTFPLMSSVSKANCCRSYDCHEDCEQSVSMFLRGDEMGRDG